MKKIFWGTIFLTLIMLIPIPTMARVDVSVGLSLPPIVFPGPPNLVVIPETNVYAVPDVDADIFFYGGWWWRPWNGRWYRSRHYDSGWGHYRGRPSFHRNVPSGWRNDYRENRWKGNQWNQQRVPHQQVQRNWRTWERSKHWEKQNRWGVRTYNKTVTRSQETSRDVKQKQDRRNHERGRN